MNKILIIDDDKELCALIKRSVQAGNIEAEFIENSFFPPYPSLAIPYEYDKIKITFKILSHNFKKNQERSIC